MFGERAWDCAGRKEGGSGGGGSAHGWRSGTSARPQETNPGWGGPAGALPPILTGKGGCLRAFLELL